MYENNRKWNKKNIKNNIEKYIKNKNYNLKTNSKKLKNNIVGVDIKAELPKKPDIKVLNNFDKNLKMISNELIKKIKNII